MFVQGLAEEIVKLKEETAEMISVLKINVIEMIQIFQVFESKREKMNF